MTDREGDNDQTFGLIHRIDYRDRHGKLEEQEQSSSINTADGSMNNNLKECSEKKIVSLKDGKSNT